MHVKLVPETSLSSTSGEVLWKKITSSTITALLLVQVSITAQSTIVHGQFCWEVRGIEGMADTAYSLVEARGMER